MALVEAESGGFATAEILDKNIAGFRQAQDSVPTVGLRDIQSDGSLAAIKRNEIGAPGAEMRSHAAGVVAAINALDLDDLGAEVG